MARFRQIEKKSHGSAASQVLAVEACDMDLSPTQYIPLGSLVTSNNVSELDAQFTALVGRQGQFVFRVAYSVVRNAQDAEDVVQDTFLKLYRTGAWKHMRDEKAFLARMSWRIAVDRHSSQKRSVKADDTLAFEADDPEARAVTADMHLLIHTLIDRLPDSLRLPLALSALEELTSGQIAQIMNISEGTVRSRLAKARVVLREKLEHISGVRNARR